ncbi:MAG: 16S rRNA (cytosine(967)-C(5))-methyltransferase RsmB, partial [Firmicutes bacterium]|nr:16S rRNA (cytosine(967)-C(5))-methyltransferase RsmB [Bacillota bacterium]
MEKNKNPRFLAVKTLNMLEKKEDFLGEVLNFHLKQGRLTPLNKAFYTELVSGTVRMRKNLDYVLGLFSRRPLKKIQPTLLNILRLGAYQILYLDRVPVSAGVNESVKLARYFGHQGTADFTNALLRKIGSMQGAIVYPSWEQKPGSHLAFKYSFPLWVVELWINWLGREETLQLCRAFNQRPEMHLRA